MEQIKKYILFFCIAVVLHLTGCKETPTTPDIDTATLKYMWMDDAQHESNFEYAVGEEVVAEKNDLYNYEKLGYVFLGWNTAPDGSGENTYAPGLDFQMPAADMDLYGLWIEPSYLNLDPVQGVSDGSYTQAEIDSNGLFVTSFVHNISDYSVASYEVSYYLWYTVYKWANENGYKFENKGAEGIDGVRTPGALPEAPHTGEPVTQINWNDALKWCNAYSEYRGLEPAYYDTSSGGSVVLRDTEYPPSGGRDCVLYDKTASGYSLLTEGEWQFIASNRGATNYDEESDSPVTVSGDNDIYNLSGSAGEWCFDGYESYTTDTKTDFVNTNDNERRVYRYGIIGERFHEDAGTARQDIGFRIKRTQ